MTGIVLSGGSSTRMGCNKALLPWKDSTFLHVILQKLSLVCDELIVVANESLPAAFPGVRFVSDIIPFRGPLSGIHAGLVHASSPYAFVTACDMPFIEPAAVAWMGSQLQDRDAVVPAEDTFIEPLFACYAKTCVPVIESLLLRDERKTQELFRHIHCRYISGNELRIFDPTLRFLRNINSPAEYQFAVNEILNSSML